MYGYEVAQTVVEVLKKCGDDLTRANVMKQAANLDLELGMLRPGIRVTTSADRLSADQAAIPDPVRREGMGAVHFAALMESTLMVLVFASSVPVTVTFSAANFSGVFWSLKS